MKTAVRAILIGAAVVLTAAAPAALPSDPRLAQIARGQPALVPRGGIGGSVSGEGMRGKIHYYGIKKFRVFRPATVLSFDMPTVEPGLKIVAVRAVFIGLPTPDPGPSGHLNVGGWPGSGCAPEWPPRGFGPTYPVEGLTVAPGDVVGFVVYIAPRDPQQLGTYTADGFRLRFNADGYNQEILYPNDLLISRTYVPERRCEEAEWTLPDGRFPV
jgi:hypothetical protein